MKVGGNFPAFDISSKGLSIQRKKMNVISENIANADTVRGENGIPYQKKFLSVINNKISSFPVIEAGTSTLRMNTSNRDHFVKPLSQEVYAGAPGSDIKMNEGTDNSPGEIVYMPGHPDADENGYVQMSNVNIITEMVDMIAASRSYEANLTALNSSKQIAKDSLEI